MSVGILTLTFYLPTCHSLKDKRRQIKPIISRLHKEFNISVIEYDHHDVWQTCQLMVACAARETAHAYQILSQVIQFFESHWPDLPLTNETIEIIQ